MLQTVTLVRLRESQSQSSTQNPSQIVQNAVQNNGGKLISAHATLGFYDLCIVASYPDQKNAFGASTALKTQHGWITETMVSESLSDFDTIYSEARQASSGSGSRR